MDKKFMRMALIEAQKAYDMGEIPIGAIIVDKNEEVVAVGHNMRETKLDATAHAEIEAIRSACAKLGKWRLSGCTMYVTIEPCPMCAGALVNSRIDRLVYGGADIKAGGVDSIFNITTNPALNHHIEVRSGVLEEECSGMMREFFKVRREQRKEGNKDDK